MLIEAESHAVTLTSVYSIVTRSVSNICMIRFCVRTGTVLFHRVLVVHGYMIWNKIEEHNSANKGHFPENESCMHVVVLAPLFRLQVSVAFWVKISDSRHMLEVRSIFETAWCVYVFVLAGGG